MNTKSEFESFFSEKRFALVGVSSDPKKFSRVVYKELLSKGFEVLPVHPLMAEIDGVKVYKQVSDLPNDVKRAVFMTPKDVTPGEIKKAITSGLDHIWVQQGAHSQKALEAASVPDIKLIHNKCIMMYASPVKGVHGFHRFLAKIFGKVPV